MTSQEAERNLEALSEYVESLLEGLADDRRLVLGNRSYAEIDAILKGVQQQALNAGFRAGYLAAIETLCVHRSQHPGPPQISLMPESDVS